MIIKVVPVKKEKKEILRNLLEKYLFEFSQFTGEGVNELGLFGYDYLDNYWTEENRYPFFIMADNEVAGFAMVNDYQEVAGFDTDYTMSEFFVIYKYRNKGVATFAANTIFNMFKGKWQLKRHPKNLASLYFWDKAVAEYTQGDYKLYESYPDTEYYDSTLGDVFIFESKKGILG